MPVPERAYWTRYRLNFRFEAVTSRQRMHYKDTYFLKIEWSDGSTTVSEIPLFKGLSADDKPDFETRLTQWCSDPMQSLPESSAIRFGIESSFAKTGRYIKSPFYRGEEAIPINGLIWMGDKTTMRSRIDEKINSGFKVLKLKIGGIDFESELNLLDYIRQSYSSETLELRLDANGSFDPDNALNALDSLSRFDIHSIEQPIKAGQIGQMAQLCKQSPIPVALDEELIGCRSSIETRELLEAIKPAFIILKPALCGGFKAADTWIEEANRLGIGWWATSALESNIGLEALAHWLTANYSIEMPQGLGTGQLYDNNIESPLHLDRDRLWYDPTYTLHQPQAIWNFLTNS